ncbi:hypothetical protein I7I51_01571 [Histoplasma capsulatum]|uniref:Uncharacterized protein n=1 Tax=Ajellomyces capsulatus TaxID=5037 RepID=A0A8A1MIL1_AJECA|nr:hypothetical protein I7I51_01571 [Histoplasma capsulatum]
MSMAETAVIQNPKPITNKALKQTQTQLRMKAFLFHALSLYPIAGFVWKCKGISRSSIDVYDAYVLVPSGAISPLQHGSGHHFEGWMMPPPLGSSGKVTPAHQQRSILAPLIYDIAHNDGVHNDYLESTQRQMELSPWRLN